ncbi:MAG: hypothetical protein IJL78_03520, partial [Lachnospiraceae bacterium]|nr:hypothetical protein [Lachnospiraceae bacterium]
IPKAGVPESFKVLLKELQSLALDVRVLRDDNTEVEITESVDYGNTDFNAILNEDTRYDRREFRSHGFTEQEIQGNEFVDVEPDEPTDDDYTDFPGEE